MKKSLFLTAFVTSIILAFTACDPAPSAEEDPVLKYEAASPFQLDYSEELNKYVYKVIPVNFVSDFDGEFIHGDKINMEWDFFTETEINNLQVFVIYSNSVLMEDSFLISDEKQICSNASVNKIVKQNIELEINKTFSDLFFPTQCEIVFTADLGPEESFENHKEKISFRTFAEISHDISNRDKRVTLTFQDSENGKPEKVSYYPGKTITKTFNTAEETGLFSGWVLNEKDRFDPYAEPVLLAPETDCTFYGWWPTEGFYKKDTPGSIDIEDLKSESEIFFIITTDKETEMVIRNTNGIPYLVNFYKAEDTEKTDEDEEIEKVVEAEETEENKEVQLILSGKDIYQFLEKTKNSFLIIFNDTKDFTIQFSFDPKYKEQVNYTYFKN